MGIKRKVPIEDVMPYLNDYLYGDSSATDLAKKFDVSTTVMTGYLNELINEMKPKKQEAVKVIEVEEKKEFTIGDWSTMTEEEKNEYK